MRAKQPDARPRGRWSRRGHFLIAALTLLCVLGVARMSTAAQIDAKPTPPAGEAQRPSPYVELVPSDLELQAMPPGIERYLAGHTLPADAFMPADLATSSLTASKDSVSPGSTFEYTIAIRNTGEFDMPTEVTNPLPEQLNYLDSECDAPLTDA